MKRCPAAALPPDLERRLAFYARMTCSAHRCWLFDDDVVARWRAALPAVYATELRRLAQGALPQALTPAFVLQDPALRHAGRCPRCSRSD